MINHWLIMPFLITTGDILFTQVLPKLITEYTESLFNTYSQHVHWIRLMVRKIILNFTLELKILEFSRKLPERNKSETGL